jgi:hypothetical protein
MILSEKMNMSSPEINESGNLLGGNLNWQIKHGSSFVPERV